MPALATIVVNAFNRPASLDRLLQSIQRADVPGGTDLHISIDGGGSAAVGDIARAFGWAHGEKTVQVLDQNIGLVAHFLHCGGLTRDLGNIVYLEDDVVVSRQFLHFARQALAAYRDDDRIAAISLNRLPINGYRRHRFEPLPDAGDAFFARIFWYEGQVYSPEMWERFAGWWRTARRPIRTEDGLHPLFLPHPRWANDFFPDGMLYLQDTGRFFAFPYESHTTQFGDPGTHFKRPTRVYQVPLQDRRNEFRFSAVDQAVAVYDSYLELMPDRLANALPGLAFNVDLNGTKPPKALPAPFTLTTRPVRHFQRSYGLEMRPAELNILHQVPGAAIRLAPTEQVRFDRFAELAAAARLDRFHHPTRPGLLRSLLYRLARGLDGRP